MFKSFKCFTGIYQFCIWIDCKMGDDVQVKRTFIVTPTSLPSFPTVRRQIWTMATSVIKVISFFCIRIFYCRSEKQRRIQCCGSGMFIPEPNFFHPGSASKNLSILASKNDLASGSGFFYPSRIQWSKGTGSRIRMRKNRADSDPD